MQPRHLVSSGSVPYSLAITFLNFSLPSLVAMYTPQAPQYRPQGAIRSLFRSSSSFHPFMAVSPLCMAFRAAGG